MAAPYYNTFTAKTSIPVPIQLLGQITTRGKAVIITAEQQQEN